MWQGGRRDKNIIADREKITIYAGELEKNSSPRYYEQPIKRTIGENTVYKETILNKLTVPHCMKE